MYIPSGNRASAGSRVCAGSPSWLLVWEVLLARAVGPRHHYTAGVSVLELKKDPLIQREGICGQLEEAFGRRLATHGRHQQPHLVNTNKTNQKERN
jgi:hypothetical protein